MSESRQSERQECEGDCAVQHGDVLLRSGGVAQRPREFPEGQSFEITKVSGLLGSGSREADCKERLVSNSGDLRAISEPQEGFICGKPKGASPRY